MTKKGTYMSHDTRVKEIVKQIESIGYRHGIQTVFDDYLTIASCTVSNTVDKVHFEEREALYMETIKKYSKEELQKIYTEEIIAKMPIVPAIDKKRSIYANASPVHLRELCKKTLSFIESEPEVIRTIDGELVVKPYRGDFLISTFRYWLMMYTDLTFNEYCVLAGLKVYETVDRHYIDYCNHSVLFQLYKKMIKIEDKFKEEKREQYNG